MPELQAPTTIPLETSPRERLALVWQTIQDAAHSARVVALAERIARQARSPRDLVIRAMVAVQDLPLIPDPRDAQGRPTEQFQPVAYTLEHGGDCEDHSAAFVTLVELNVIPGALTWMTLEPVYPLNHISAKTSLDGGATWLWAETSVRGAALGEEPLHAAERLRDWGFLNAG